MDVNATTKVIVPSEHEELVNEIVAILINIETNTRASRTIDDTAYPVINILRGVEELLRLSTIPR
jgi:hypothetical protein